MPEVTQNEIELYEHVTSTALLEEWGKSKGPEEVTKLINGAIEVTLESEKLLTPQKRLNIARDIKRFIKDFDKQLIARFGNQLHRILELIQEIENSKGINRVSFVELHRLTVQILLRDRKVPQEQNIPTLDLRIAEFKARLLAHIREYVRDIKELGLKDRIIKLKDDLDTLGDDLRSKKPFEEVVEKLLYLLVEDLDVEGAAISYNVPIGEEVEFNDDLFPAHDLSQENVVMTGGIDPEKVQYAVNQSRKTTEKSETEDLDIVPTGVGEDPQAYCVVPIIIRDSKIGELVLSVKDRNQVDKQFKILAQVVEAYVDTLIDVGTASQLKERLLGIVNRISTSANVSELPDALKKMCTLLSQLIGSDISFLYNDGVNENDSTGFRIIDNHIQDCESTEAQGKLAEITKEEDSGGHYVHIEVKRKKLFEEKPPNEMEPEYLGTLVIEGDNNIDILKRELIHIVAGMLKVDVLSRKEAFERAITGAGYLVSKFAIEGDLEWRGTHPVAVWYVDIASSTAFSEQVGGDQYAEMLNEFYSGMSSVEMTTVVKKKGLEEDDYLLNEMLAQAEAQAKKTVFDKPKGDEGMFITGAPFRKDGRDFMGNMEHKPMLYVSIGLHNKEVVRLKWERILDKYDVPFRPQLRTGLDVDVAQVGFVGGDKDDSVARRLDYTVLGDLPNRAARVTAGVEPGETGLRRSVYEEYRQFVEDSKRNGTWDPTILEFEQEGLCTIIFGQGVANPIECVKVETVENLKMKRKKQKEVFEEKSQSIKNPNEVAFNSPNEIPDGDYFIVHKKRRGSNRQFRLKFEGIEQNALISELNIDEDDRLIPIDVYDKLRESSEGQDILDEGLARVENDKVVIIYYKCIEFEQMERIAKLRRESMRKGRGMVVDYEDIPVGEYLIRSHKKIDGGHEYEVSRMGETVIILIPDQELKGEAFDSGVLVCQSRKFSCKSGPAEWEHLIKMD